MPKKQVAAALPAWLVVGASVYDIRLKRWGEVMALAWPSCELRQMDRAWLRPPDGGREWNPLVADLAPKARPSTRRRALCLLRGG